LAGGLEEGGIGQNGGAKRWVQRGHNRRRAQEWKKWEIVLHESVQSL